MMSENTRNTLTIRAPTRGAETERRRVDEEGE